MRSGDGRLSSLTPGRHWIGKKGGGNTERALKNGFGVIPYFLEIADVGEAYLIFEIISVLPKVHSSNRPHRLKTQMCVAKQKCVLQNTNAFCQSKHICVLNQNTFVFCHTPDNCYHI